MKKLLLLPGDGIGSECMAQVEKLIACINHNTDLKISYESDHIGGSAYDLYDEPLTDDTIAKAKASDAILLGAVGGEKWDSLPYGKRPERGLLKIRKELDLFANLRPAFVFNSLVDASTLKADVVRKLDILIVRELTGGIYFGEPRGISELGNGERKGVNTQVYTSAEIRRIIAVAVDLSRKRQKNLCSVEKANVMESGMLWREETVKYVDNNAPDINLSHMYADNCAMQLVRNPKQFDVIVTDNLFGDLLSDCAAMLTGSLGMLPSASLGAKQACGKQYALYEPVHGSAPDIAGEDKANPLATILSFSMCLRYSLDRADIADALDKSVENVLDDNIRTADIAVADSKVVGTEKMGNYVQDYLLERLS